MSDLFFNLGRKLGRAAVPALRKTKWLWQSVAGTEEESIRAETRFGRAMAEELRTRLPLATDQEDQALVGAMGRQLSGKCRDQGREFQVEAVDTRSPMAMALPGGFIFVDVVLLEACGRDPDELAFVIGHEMAHVLKRHTFDRILRRVGVDVISKILGRGALGMWLRTSGLPLLRTAHTQDLEFEADALAADLARDAGYDPKGAGRFLHRWPALGAGSDGPCEYVESHPPAPKRIARLQAHWGQPPD